MVEVNLLVRVFHAEELDVSWSLNIEPRLGLHRNNVCIEIEIVFLCVKIALIIDHVIVE